MVAVFPGGKQGTLRVSPKVTFLNIAWNIVCDFCKIITLIPYSRCINKTFIHCQKRNTYTYVHA